MFFDLTCLSALLFVTAFWCFAPMVLKLDRNSHRTLVCVVALLIGARYLLWRYFFTLDVPPYEELPPAGSLWAHLVFFFELLAFGEIFLFLLVMCKTNTRSAEADSCEKSSERTPSVDVFIPTYNEGLDVLEKTIVGAKNLDYPDFKVWVLDDGRRQWLKEFCEKKAVGYITRPDNLHAKAGNINNALKRTNSELFAIFDADFVPARNFLRRTTGFFVKHEDVGIVQTPQHFFNRDPIQSNLYLHKVWPDEQRLFFDVMAPARDGWGAAFCCGSCSITRRKAVEAAGGIPTSSITEDILTTLSLLTVGYKTIYLNEKLSQGLSAESLEGFFVQRSRWCRGGIQCFFVKEGPLRSKGLTFLQRVLFTPYGWVVQPITRLVLLLVPAVYLWTGAVPMFYTSDADILRYQIPMILMYILTIHWFAPRKYIPIISTAIGVFTMFRLLPVVISSLVKPFGVPFRVTPKGAANRSGTDWYTLSIVIVFLLLTLSGIAVNLIPEWRILTFMQFFPYAVAWSSLNVLILAICALICFDAPRHRKEERFEIDEEASVAGAGKALLENLSLGGCKLRLDAASPAVKAGDFVSIGFKDVDGEMKAEVKGCRGTTLMCQFSDMPEKQRDQLIAKIFTGRYNNEITTAEKFSSVITSILSRTFGKEMK